MTCWVKDISCPFTLIIVIPHRYGTFTCWRWYQWQTSALALDWVVRLLLEVRHPKEVPTRIPWGRSGHFVFHIKFLINWLVSMDSTTNTASSECREFESMTPFPFHTFSKYSPSTLKFVIHNMIFRSAPPDRSDPSERYDVRSSFS